MKWFFKFFSESTDNTSGELNAFLGTGTRFTGHLQFEGSVRIDGNFQGNISSPGTLILGRDAVVKGEIDVSSLNVNGTVIGVVRATRHVHLHENAVIDGLLVTPAMGMDEGAIINGTVEMKRAPVANEAEVLEGSDHASLGHSTCTAISTTSGGCCDSTPDPALAQNEDGG